MLNSIWRKFTLKNVIYNHNSLASHHCVECQPIRTGSNLSTRKWFLWFALPIRELKRAVWGHKSPGQSFMTSQPCRSFCDAPTVGVRYCHRPKDTARSPPNNILRTSEDACRHRRDSSNPLIAGANRCAVNHEHVRIYQITLLSVAKINK